MMAAGHTRRRDGTPAIHPVRRRSVSQELVDRLAAETARAVKDPKIVERLANFGIEPLGTTSEEFAAGIAADVAFWAEAARIADAHEK